MFKKFIVIWLLILNFCLQDEPEMRKRVVAALGLLVGAKVLNVCVPYLFKIGVDTLGPVADFTSAVDTVSTFTFAVLVGCKFQMHAEAMDLMKNYLLFFRWCCSGRSSWF